MHLVFLLYALFGSVFTIGKFALECAQPFFIVGSRMTFAGILLLAFQFFRDRNSLKIDGYIALRLGLLAFFSIFLTNICEFWGLKYLTSGKTCLLYSFSPFISALLSYFVLSETLSRTKWIGLIAGFLGFIPILTTQSSEELAAGTFFIFSWPELAVIVAAAASVYGWILIRQLIKEKGMSPFSINGYSMLFGGIMSLAWSFLMENASWTPLPVTNYVGFLESALALLLISNFICYNLYGHLLKSYTATFMSFAGFTTPIFAALFGWFFLGETMPWQFWLSLTAVFLSLYIFHREEIKPGFVHVKQEAKAEV